MAAIGVVVGLKSEWACLARHLSAEAVSGVRCAGARPEVAAAAAEDLCASGIDGLVSFGMAGGLDPHLVPGTLVLANAVATDCGVLMQTDSGWRHRLIAALGTEFPIASGPLLAVDGAVASLDDKSALRQRTGATAMDMESGAVGLVAARYKRPLLIIRVIADPASMAFPPWLAGVVLADGSTALSRVLGGLLRHPTDAVALFRVAAASRAAMRTLSRVAPLAGTGFQFSR